MSSHTNSKPENVSMMHTQDKGVDRFTSSNPPQHRPVNRESGVTDQGGISSPEPVMTPHSSEVASDQTFKPHVMGTQETTKVEQVMQPAMNNATNATKSTRRHRQISEGVYVDHYDVVTAFNVTCPAQISIIEKILLASQSDPSQVESMLRNAQDDIVRALELHKKRQQLG